MNEIALLQSCLRLAKVVSQSLVSYTCGRVVFSVCDCFVAVCGDCILC